MTIAELFVKVGLSGTDGVTKGLKKVQEDFKGVVSGSLQMKAAIIGAFVGMERLTAYSSQLGMDMFKFANATGLSTNKLQQWQHMARQFDAEGDVQGTVEAIQRAMAQMELGEGMPKGFALLGIETEGKDAFDILDQLEKKVKTVSPKLGLELVSGLGISSNMFQALRNINQQRDRLDSKLLLSPKQIGVLKDINIEWKNFWFNLKRMGTLTTAQVGGTFIGTFKNAIILIKDVVLWVKELTDKFSYLKYVIGAIAVAIAYAFAPLTTIVAGIVFTLSKIQEFRELLSKSEKGRKSDEKAGRETPTFTGWVKDLLFKSGSIGGGIGESLVGASPMDERANARAEAIMKNPKPLMTSNAGTNSTNNTNTNTTNFFIDGKDVSGVLMDSTKKDFRNTLAVMTGRLN